MEDKNKEMVQNRDGQIKRDFSLIGMQRGRIFQDLLRHENIF